MTLLAHFLSWMPIWALLSFAVFGAWCAILLFLLSLAVVVKSWNEGERS